MRKVKSSVVFSCLFFISLTVVAVSFALAVKVPVSTNAPLSYGG